MTDYTELKLAAETVKQAYADLCEHGGDELAEAWNTAELAYDDAANPEAVLALIAENERLNAENKQLIVLEFHGGTAEAAINLLAERDQLKAEVDSLTREADRQYTTIEAYRQDAERYRWLLKNTSVILDKKAAYPAETGFIKFDTMPGRTETESAIDAAMGKGEQS